MKDFPEIPTEMLSCWQRVVDLIADLAEVPASLVMRTHALDHAVLVSNCSHINPYHVGQNFILQDKLYCHTVLHRDSELVVEDARCASEWADNLDLEADGMSFYIGLPLHWPDGAAFGTICMLDRQRNDHALAFRATLQQFAWMIERDLALLGEIARREELERQLQQVLISLEDQVTARTCDLDQANTALRVLICNVETSRQRYDAEVLRQIKGLVLPHLGKLRSRLTQDPAAWSSLDLMEESLTKISSNMCNRLSHIFAQLTPTEQEIAQMIIRGQSTKDIARVLSREPSTIEFHRTNIRKKLGLRLSGQNLRSMLRSMQ